jgi:hypothetical protein
MRLTFVGITLIALFVVSGLINLAEASAPRGTTQYAGLVLNKLDTISPPSYTNDFFWDRDLLSRDVEAVLRLMTDPLNNDSMTWCMGISDILNFATLTTAYFDISQPNNPALDDFKKDCLKVKQLAGCP